jgi:flagellar biosynthesis protein
MDETEGPHQPGSVAVALHYESGTAKAPTVVAKGLGLLADQIVAKAQEAGVPVERNPALAHSLAQLEVDQTIPRELYKAVAEVIGYLMRKGRRV